ncbi:MAG: hypothetical protein P4L20_00435 [Acidimicrobiales bacterium]|nr:hypothetical protein [Acidimicrobiales bacterium]
MSRNDAGRRTRPGRRTGTALGIVAGALVLAACSSGTTNALKSTSTTAAAKVTESTNLPSTGPLAPVTGGVTGKPGYFVYWDQNEEVDLLSMPSGTQGQLLPAWDLNGQMCVLPDGRFVGGYDPTLPGQRNLGSAKPYKQPADGEELDNPDGAFSGQTLYVPGPYKLPGQTVGSDSPPTPDGVFNNNQTYTGCAVDKTGDVFGNDIATAQGAYPSPSSGRLVEWFAPSYTTYCIVYGPNSGGVGPHHTDGSGGLAQPGMMALADNGDLLVPNVGTSSVLRFAASSLPRGASQCPGGLYPRSKVQVSTFYKASFAAGIAKDPTCDCYAVSSYIGDPSIKWVSQSGQPEANRGSVPGTTIANLGKSPDQYNPFGMAFAPDGTLYFIDIHIACKGLLTGCGPASYGGRVMKVTFTNGQPSTPVAVATGFDFPTSVTICVPATTVCPYPSGAIAAPLSGPAENPSPDKGPASNAPATAGFG